MINHRYGDHADDLNIARVEIPFVASLWGRQNPKQGARTDQSGVLMPPAPS